MVCLSYRSRSSRSFECDPACWGRRITVEGVAAKGKTVDSYVLWLTDCQCTQVASIIFIFIVKNFPFDLHCPRLLQSEDDCAGHETTRYTFVTGDQLLGNITADALGLRSFSKRGDMAQVTLTVPADMTDSSLCNLSVILSNIVKFMEVITSSTGGVRSALRSNTWTTTLDTYICEYIDLYVCSYHSTTWTDVWHPSNHDTW